MLASKDNDPELGGGGGAWRGAMPSPQFPSDGPKEPWMLCAWCFGGDTCFKVQARESLAAPPNLPYGKIR